MFGVSTFSETPFSSLAVQTIVVTLTGVGAAGQVGTANYFYWEIIDNSQNSVAVVRVFNVDVQDSSASPEFWFADGGSVNSGNNTNWIFDTGWQNVYMVT
jgi:hypothetical protein